MTLDKVTAIKIPQKSAILCTAKRAWLVSVMNFFIMIAFYLPNLYFSKMVGDNACARYIMQGWYVTVYSYISLLLNPVIPVVILFVMNIIVIGAVWKSERMSILNENQMGWDKNKSSEI